MSSRQQKHDLEERWLDVEGVRIFYRLSEGSGPAVVLLQGGMLDSSTLTWRRVIEGLPPHYRLFAPDFPGYGRSDKQPAPYTTGYLIDFLAGFLEALGLERVYLGGSSMSGAVALGYALRAPERVAGLVLSGAYGWQPRVPLHRLAYLAAHVPGLPALVRAVLQRGPAVMRLALRVAIADPRAITDELVRDACAGVAADGQLDAFTTWLRSELGPRTVRSNFAGELHRLAMPVLILHGERDWMMPPAYARRAHERLPHSTLHLFPTAGHMVPREHPAEVTALIDAFLTASEAS